MAMRSVESFVLLLDVVGRAECRPNIVAASRGWRLWWQRHRLSDGTHSTVNDLSLMHNMPLHFLPLFFDKFCISNFRLI